MTPIFTPQKKILSMNLDFPLQDSSPIITMTTTHQPPPPPPTTTISAATEELPTTTASKPKSLTLIPLIFLIYFEVAGGPYGEEPAVKAAGPLLAILGFLIFPFIWSIPEALITAELSTAFPGNGGFVIWADRAFGPFFGSLMGTLKFLSGVINIAAFPALCIDYLKRIFPIFAGGRPRTLAIVVSTILLSILNYTGLAIVGYVGVALGLISLAPFLLMSLIALPQIRPHRWISLGQAGVKKDWNLFFNTLFWNLNFWDNVSTMAGEVENPRKTFPLALFCAVIFTCLGYIIPLVAVTGAVEVDQSLWEAGFMADAARIISGQWLKLWIEIGAVLSSVGLFEAQLSSSAYQILGMAELAFLPRFFGAKSRRFDTPWVGIVVSSAIALAVSFMSYSDIVSSANLLYSMGMLLEFAAFLYLRVKLPELKRPYKVPFGVPVLAVMCLVPSGFLVYIMVLAHAAVWIVCAAMLAAGVGWFFLMRLCQRRGWFKFARVAAEQE